MESKKNPKLDYTKKYGLLFNMGLALSLTLVISAFELRFAEDVSEVDLKYDFFAEETELIQITEQKPPPKPQHKQIKIIEVDDDEIIDIDDLDISLDIIEVDKIEDISDLFVEDKKEEAEEIVVFAEKMPSFKGGQQAFYRFVSKNLKYPVQARRMGIEGKVFVHFVVDKDGSLNDIKIVRGIGAGCDEEVLRIIQKCPVWNPGKQRGNPVRVRMMLPITFRLD